MYMVTHKHVDFIPSERKPIFVGSGDNTDNFICDHINENISEKNRNYCELTALYWIWKNDKESDYISIEHYRRFFTSKMFPLRTIQSAKVINILKKNRIITTTLNGTKMNLWDFYHARHHGEDLVFAREAVSMFYPEYVTTFDKVFSGHKACMYNMLAMSKEDFDSYCSWLFKILFYVEKKVDLSQRTAYQQRAFGFLSERLLNVWVAFQKKKVVRLPVYYLEETKLKTKLKTLINLLPSYYNPKKPRG